MQEPGCGTLVVSTFPHVDNHGIVVDAVLNPTGVFAVYDLNLGHTLMVQPTEPVYRVRWRTSSYWVYRSMIDVPDHPWQACVRASFTF